MHSSFKGCLTQILLGPFLNTLTQRVFIEASESEILVKVKNAEPLSHAKYSLK